MAETEMSRMTLVRHVTVTEDHWEVRPETMAQLESVIDMLRQFCGISVSDRREEKERERLAAERDREAFQKKLDAMTPEDRKVAERQHEIEKLRNDEQKAHAKGAILMSLLPVVNDIVSSFTKKKDPLDDLVECVDKLTRQIERNSSDLNVIKEWFQAEMSGAPAPAPEPMVTPPPCAPHPPATSSETKPCEAHPEVTP